MSAVTWSCIVLPSKASWSYVTVDDNLSVVCHCTPWTKSSLLTMEIKLSRPLYLYCSITKSCLTVTPWTVACQASFTISLNLLQFMSIESMMPSNHLIFCCLLLLLPSIFLSIRAFPCESAFCNRWPNYWSFSFSISPSKGYSRLISLRMDWFALLAAQGTLKHLLQHHNLKPSILQCSAFLMVQLSHPYMIARKTIALTIIFDYDFSHLGR